MFMDFWKFIVLKSALTLFYDDTSFEYWRHRDFIVQQIQEGKTVVLLAHG